MESKNKTVYNTKIVVCLFSLMSKIQFTEESSAILFHQAYSMCMEWKGVLKIDLDRETVPDFRDPSSEKKYWKTFRYCAAFSCLLRILRCFGNLLSHTQSISDSC